MPKKWTEVIASPEFQAMTPEKQEQARAAYFSDVIAPNVPPEARAAAQATFDGEYGPGGKPPDLGPAPEKRGILSELGRQLGLTARHGIAGVAALPAMASDAVTGVINTGADALLGKGNGFRFQSAGRALQDTMTAAGLPEPVDGYERVIGDMSSAVAGGTGVMKAGQVLAGAASPVAAAVGNGLSQGAGLQGVSAATGAGAAGLTREAGGGVGAQIAAGLLGGLAPGVGRAGVVETVRRGLRGGEEGRQRVAGNIDLFQKAADTSPSLGQATGSRAVQAVESTLAKMPGGAGVMSKFAQRQADDMASAVQKAADDLAPGANSTTAGEAITRGVDAFKKGFKEVQGRLYNELDQHLPNETPITVTRTQEALAALNAEIPGAPNLSQWFKNGKIVGIEKSLDADVAGAAAAKSYSPSQLKAATEVSSNADELAAALNSGALPYQAIKKLRTLVGGEITNNSLVSDVPRSKWQALYGALTDDLGDAAKAAGPKAEQAWTAANDFTKAHMQRLEELSSIVGRDSPEKIFSAAISGTAEGNTVIARVMKALPAEERRQVSAAVLQRLGRATPGQQNAMGDAFSSETFLTNLSKMSPAARTTIFGGKEGEVDGVVTQLARLAETRRDGGKVFSNPSGTAGAAAQLATSAGLGAGAAMTAMTGNPGHLATALVAPAVANVAAKVVTSPRVAQFAAGQTVLKDGAEGAAAAAAIRTAAAAPPPEQRQIGKVYNTPRGPMTWRGNGWEPAR